MRNWHSVLLGLIGLSAAVCIAQTNATGTADIPE